MSTTGNHLESPLHRTTQAFLERTRLIAVEDLFWLLGGTLLFTSIIAFVSWPPSLLQFGSLTFGLCLVVQLVIGSIQTWYADDDMEDSLLEILGIYAFTWGATALLFLQDMREVRFAMLPYPLFPLLIWAAMRLRPCWVVGILWGMSFLLIVGTWLGKGPFLRVATPEDRLFMAVTFSLSAWLISMFIALSRRESRARYLRVQVMNDELKRTMMSKHETESRLQESELKFKAIFDSLFQLVAVLTPDGKIVSANRSALDMVGVRADQIVGKDFWETPWWSHSDEMRDRAHDAVTRAAKGEMVRFEAFHPRPDGSVGWVDFSVKPYRDAKGRTLFLIPEGRDITELRSAREKWEQLLESTPDALILVDEQGKMVHANQRSVKLFGHSRQELIGQPIEILVPAEIHEQHVTFRDRYFRETQGRRPMGAGRDLVGVRKDGSRFAAEVALNPTSLDGKPYVFASIRDCGQRVAIEKAIREERDRFDKIASVIPGMIYTYQARPDGTNCFPFLSIRSVDVLGLRHFEVKDDGSRAWANVLEEDALAMKATVEESAKNGTEWRHEFRYRHPTKGEIWIEGRSSPTYEPDGGIVWHGFMMEITERKCNEKSLRESEQRLAEAQKLGRMGSWKISLKTGQFEMSRENYRLYGLDPNQPIPPFEEFVGMVHADDQDFVRRNFAIAYEGGNPYSHDYRWIRPGGEVVWLHVRIRMIRDADGTAIAMEGTNQDITDLKRVMIDLESQRELLRLFIKHAPAAIAMLDRDLRYLQVSDKWLRDYKLGNQNLIGRHHYEIFPEIEERWKEIHRNVLAGSVEQGDEDPFPRSDGSVDWLQWEARPWKTSGGEIGGVMLLTQVVTERKKAAEELQQSRERFRAAFEYAAVGMAVVDLEGRLIRVNPQFAAIFGRDDSELFQFRILDLTHPDDVAASRERMERLIRGDFPSLNLEKRFFRKDGSIIHALTAVALVRTHDGAPLYFVGQVEDVTERNLARDRLLESVREKEVMLREIHHRVKNNMAVISSLFHLQASSTKDQATAAVLIEAKDRVRSMAMVHEHLYNSKNLGAVDFAAVLKRLSEEIFETHRLPTKSIRLEIRVTPVYLSVDQAIPCGLILNELISNCFKHAFNGETGSKLEIEASECEGNCRISVGDDGIGMSESSLTSQTSLGMRLVRSLARQLDADLQYLPGYPGTIVTLIFRIKHSVGWRSGG